MPKKWIEFPPKVMFYDPATKEAIKDKDGKETSMDFEEFLSALMGNPLWNEGFAQAQAQDSIMRAFEEAKEQNAPGMWVAEEDHKFLEKSAKEPKTVLIIGGTAQIMNGFGRHPSMSRQFLTLQESIIKAKSESEKAKADEERKKKEEELKKAEKRPSAVEVAA